MTEPNREGSSEMAERVAGSRRVREQAWDGLAAVSLGGSIAVTLALGLLLRWLG